VRQGRRALLAELRAKAIVVLAPETLHAAPSQEVGARNGQTCGASLVWGTRGVKDREPRG